MKYRSVNAILIILNLCLSQSSFGQEVYEFEGFHYSKEIHDLFAEKIIDIAIHQNPNLFWPKDEFETTAEYNQRLKQQLEFIRGVEKEYYSQKRVKEAEAKRLATERAAEEERLLQIKIAESLAPVKFTPSALGKYDAENGTFPLTVGGLTYNVEIPRSEARTFRDNYTSAKVEGYKQLRSIYDITTYKSQTALLETPSLASSVKGLRAKGFTYTNVVKEGKFFKISKEARRLEVEKAWAVAKEARTEEARLAAEEARLYEGPPIFIPIPGFGFDEQEPEPEPVPATQVFEVFIYENEVKAVTKLTGDYEYFNMVVIHPITGSRFPFGPTKDIAAAPVIAGKKSVVPPDLTMRVAFVEPNGNGFLDAEEKGKVKVSISNSGKGSAMGVFVKLNAETSNREISAETSKIIGEIPVGQTKTTEFFINANKSVTRMVNKFTVSATESYGFPPDPIKISFETFPFIPPELKLVDFGISTPNEGNEIRPQTTTEVQARVQNRGQGPAEDVKFSINLPKGVYFTPDSRQDYSFSSLKPGEFKDLEFSFNTAKTVGKTIAVSIGFTEESTTGKFPLDLEVEKPQKTIQQLVVKGQELGTVEFADVATVSVDIEKDIPTSGRKGKNDLAVVFGIESYKNVPSVSFARRDAEWMKKYFENVLGIPKNRIYYKTDSDVGQAEFNKVFGERGWIEKRIKNGKTNVFVYYAGHGAPYKKTAYLIPYDGDPNYASQTGYEMDKLYEQLGSFEAQSTTVFLDACFSGANRDNEMLLADARPVFMEVDASATRNVTVFSASSGSEISSAWPEKKHGLFSYFLMKGMRGDADANNDNQITVGELGDYVKENVSDMAGMLDREQTPGLQTMDPNKVLIQY